jgi:hypothetical protein
VHISLLVTHHQEAIAIVKVVIARVRERRQRGSAGDLAIIVGAGHHSEGGARIRPAIERYLYSNSIAYCMVSAGEVRGADFLLIQPIVSLVFLSFLFSHVFKTSLPHCASNKFLSQPRFFEMRQRARRNGKTRGSC